MDHFYHNISQDILGKYPDYEPIASDRLSLRRMTDTEFGVIPNKFKSKPALLFSSGSGAGIGFVIASIFSGAVLIGGVAGIVKHEPDAGMFMFAMSMVALFVMSIAALGVMTRLNRYVTRDSLVTAGEVVQVSEPIRRSTSIGARDYGVGYDCVIALHGNKRLVTIRDGCRFRLGATVLVIRNRDLHYFLYEIPAYAAAYDLETNDPSAEINAGRGHFTGDYGDYEKVDLFSAFRHDVIGEEYKDIPAKYRTCSPFSHGLLSKAWAVTTAAFLIVTGLLLYAKITDNEDMFIVNMILFFCLLFFEYLFSIGVLKSELPKGKTSRIQCVPIRKVKNNGRCFASVIIPDHRQYIERLEVEPSVYGSIRENEEVDLYFNSTFPVAKYARSRYEKY